MTGQLPEGAVAMPARVGDAAAKFRNRIIGHGWEDPEQLLANPFNHRVHSRMQSKALVAALEEYGWAAEVRINVNTQHMVDGHLRCAEAISAGEQVPVTYLDLTEAEERAILATFDALGGMSSIDEMTLASNVEDLDLPSPLAGVVGELLGDMAGPDGVPDPNDGAGDDLPEVTMGWGYVTWGKRKTGCSTGEVDLLEDMFQSYKDENGSEVGFVRWLVEAARRGAEE
jgi:hypothetical protein